MNEKSKINLLNFDRKLLREYFINFGEKPFRADQVIKWIHKHGYTDFEKMTKAEVIKWTVENLGEIPTITNKMTKAAILQEVLKLIDG